MNPPIETSRRLQQIDNRDRLGSDILLVVPRAIEDSASRGAKVTRAAVPQDNVSIARLYTGYRLPHTCCARPASAGYARRAAFLICISDTETMGSLGCAWLPPPRDAMGIETKLSLSASPLHGDGAMQREGAARIPIDESTFGRNGNGSPNGG